LQQFIRDPLHCVLKAQNTVHRTLEESDTMTLRPDFFSELVLFAIGGDASAGDKARLTEASDRNGFTDLLRYIHDHADGTAGRFRYQYHRTAGYQCLVLPCQPTATAAFPPSLLA